MVKLTYSNGGVPKPFIAIPPNQSEMENLDAPEARFEAAWEPNSEKCTNAIGEIIKRLQNYETIYKLRKRARRPKDQQQFGKLCTWLVSSMIERELSEPWGWLAISLSNRNYKKASKYTPHVGKTVSYVLTLLATREMGFCEISYGKKAVTDGEGKLIEKSKTTRFRPRNLLKKWLVDGTYSQQDIKIAPHVQTIILKDQKKDFWDKGEWIEYQDTPQTELWRAEMKEINDWLANVNIGYVGATEANVTRRLLRRYFVNRKFTQGGRMFGGFWQNLPSDDRNANLRIDGEEIADLDYRQSQPRLLYAVCGVVPEFEDAYAIPGLEQAERKHVKEVLNAALCSKKKLTQYPHGTRKGFPKKLKIANTLDLIMAFHHQVAHKLYKGYGLDLQLHESERLVEVLKRAKAQNLTALPMHDGILVARSRANEAIEIMNDASIATIGVAGLVSIKHPITD